MCRASSPIVDTSKQVAAISQADPGLPAAIAVAKGAIASIFFLLFFFQSEDVT
jgi:hypothetical protein